MKIAYILNTYPMGSHSFIRREIQALERLGHTVLRFAMRAPPQKAVDPLNAAEQAKTEYVLTQSKSTLLRAGLNGGLSSLALALRVGVASEQGRGRHLIYWAEACYLAQRCRLEKVDHIHAHFGTNAATVAMILSHITGIPFSFTVHGPEEFDQPMGLSLSEKMHRGAFTVAISQFGRSQLCRWAAPADWGRIKVVHCGIEPAAFARPQPVPPVMDAKPFRLINIGRFAEQKGQINLIKAMAHLKQDMPNLHLTLVGDGEMRSAIEVAIRDHQVEQQVTLTGWLDEDAIREALDRSHAMVLPSFAEGLPMVVMEAMAAARPVIATYIAGIPELVQNGETGLLVPAGDVTALAAAIRSTGEKSAEHLNEMGVKGRVRVFARHDIDDQAAQLARYFEEGA